MESDGESGRDTTTTPVLGAGVAGQELGGEGEQRVGELLCGIRRERLRAKGHDLRKLVVVDPHVILEVGEALLGAGPLAQLRQKSP